MKNDKQDEILKELREIRKAIETRPFSTPAPQIIYVQPLPHQLPPQNPWGTGTGDPIPPPWGTTWCGNTQVPANHLHVTTCGSGSLPMRLS